VTHAHLVGMEDTIPVDVWPLIAQFMDVQTKRLMRLASTKWFNIIKYNDFTLYYSRSEDVPAITDRLSKYSWPIELSFNKHKNNDALDVIAHLSKLTNLKKIKNSFPDISIKTDITLEQWMCLSTLTNIECWNFLENDTPLDLLKKFTKLTYFKSNSDEEHARELLKGLPNLDSLIFRETSSTWPFALIPNPEKLTLLKMTSQIPQQHGRQMWSRLVNLRKMYVADNDLTEDNAPELKYLTALESCHLYLKSLPLLETNTNLTSLRLNCGEWSRTNSDALAKLTKLKSLDITVNQGLDLFNQFKFGSHLPALAELTLNASTDTIAIEVDPRIYHFLPPTLKALAIRVGTSLDLAFLTHLTNLRSLVIETAVINHECLENFPYLTELQLNVLNDHGNLRAIEKMTRLEALSIEKLVQSVDACIPNLEGLFHMRVLQWCSQQCPSKIIRGLKYLTNLERLMISPKEDAENNNFLLGLLKLTSLTINRPIKHESFWSSLSSLTNIQVLSLRYIDNDDRLLPLSALNNLTRLEIHRSSSSFTGCHFTALTSLQSIWFAGNGLQLVHKKKDILKSLPYLLTYSYFVPL